MAEAAIPYRPGSCTVDRLDIGDLLPVYVADRYEGIEARTFAECSYVDACAMDLDERDRWCATFSDASLEVALATIWRWG